MQVIRRLTQVAQTIHSIDDLSGNRVAEYLYDTNAGTSSLIREYLWLGAMPLAVIEGGQVYFVRTDHIGRPVFATDASGTKVWEAAYLPFGGVATSTGTPIALRFPGQWFQAEAGLHQNWMRDYDPTTGRYIQADPLGLVDGASVYGYALQNPGRYVDPTGEAIPALLGWAAGGVVVGYVYKTWWRGECYTWEDFLWDAGAGIAGGYAFKGVGWALGKSGWGSRWGWGAGVAASAANKLSKGLGGNPFKGKTPAQIDKMLKKKGYKPKGPDPMNGKGTYQNPKTGRSYHIDGNHPPPKGPHVGAIRPRGNSSGGRRGRNAKDFEM